MHRLSIDKKALEQGSSTGHRGLWTLQLGRIINKSGDSRAFNSGLSALIDWVGYTQEFIPGGKRTRARQIGPDLNLQR